MLEVEAVAVHRHRHGLGTFRDDALRDVHRRLGLVDAVVRRVLLGGRVACGERLGHLLVVRVAVRDPERLERSEERVLRVGERDAVLRPPRSRDRRDDLAQVELDDLRVRRLVRGVVPEQVLLAVRLDERDLLLASTGQPQVAERHVVDREEAARRAVLRRHVPDRRAVGERQRRQPLAEVLDKPPDDADAPQDLGHGEHEVGRGRAFGQLPLQLEADDLRHEHRDRLAEHRGFGLDPADAPAQHAEAVDHRRVRVGPDERVGERLSVARLDDAREVLEVDLVDDARVRRDDLEVAKRRLPPAQERVALLVPLELELGVVAHRDARRVLVHLHRVVDHELGGQQRVDLLRVAAEVAHRVAHRGEVDDRGHPGEVLEQHARRREGDLLARVGARVPARDGLDVALVSGPERVLEQDLEGVGEPVDVEAVLQGVEAEDLVLPASDAQRRACGEGVGHGLDSTGRARDQRSLVSSQARRTRGRLRRRPSPTCGSRLPCPTGSR